MENKKRCRHCKEYGEVEAGVTVPLGWFCSMDHVIAHANEKSKAKQIKAFKKETVKLKKQVREHDRSWHLKEAQSWFNKYIRLRDAGKPCISCDKPDNGQHQRHASHYRSVGACSSLRYDENNVHASCMTCNTHLSGNIREYTPRLIQKIGQAELERLQCAPKLKAWTIDDLKEIIKAYKEKCKQMNKQT
jgi:hypothetical protein